MTNLYILLCLLILHGSWSRNVPLPNPIQNVFANKGSTVILPCKLPGFDTRWYKVIWSRDSGTHVIASGQRMQSADVRYSVTQDGFYWNLTIKNLQPRDNGNYTCHLNTNPPSTQITKLQIQGERPDTKWRVQVKEGENIRIECSIFMTKKPSVKWYKEDKPQIYSLGPTMVIQNVSMNDSGDYRCDASTKYHRYSKQLTLQVKGIAIPLPPRNMTVVSGSTVTLPCKFTGINLRLFQVIWSHERGGKRTIISFSNVILTASDRYTIKNDDSQSLNLQIKNLQPEDGGKYICQVESDGTKRQIVNLQVQELRSRVNNKTALQGSTVVLPCWYQRNIDSPHTRVMWFDNNILAVSNNRRTFRTRYQIIQPTRNDWNLQITDVQPFDTGNFSCRLLTKDGTWNKTVALKVGAPPKFESVLPEEMVVTEGESLTLICNTSGSPQPSVSWYKYSDKFEKRIVSQGQRLVLPHVTRYDAGNFECIAENSFPPTASMKTDIQVDFAPEIQFLEGRLEVEKGSETILKCDVTAYPQSAVMWLREGKKLFNSWKYRIDVTEEGVYAKQVTLSVKNIEDGDFGSYVCQARNKLDKIQRALELFESDKKIVIKAKNVNNIEDKRVISVKKGSSAVLPCELETESTPYLPVLWYETRAWNILSIDQLSQTNDPRYRVYRPSSTQWNLIIEDVREDDEKSYSCLINTDPKLNETFYLKVE